jgi:uncharacterized protein (TIGR02145 family)
MTKCPLIAENIACKQACPIAACPILKPKPDFGTFTDPRDGRTYKTVKIGSQVWMAENLNFDYKGAMAYEYKPENRKNYGLLYDWETAKKAVPPGWHLPSNEEWDTLIEFCGGKDVAGKKLKAASGWNDYGNGTDNYGFAALPGGNRYSDGLFYNAGNYGYWWSASEYDAGNAYYRYMSYNYDSAYLNNYDKTGLFSVRCLQDCGGGK